jgi:hypothetical protein
MRRRVAAWLIVAALAAGNGTQALSFSDDATKAIAAAFVSRDIPDADLRAVQHLIALDAGLPDAADPPRIVFAAEREMRFLRLRDVAGDRRGEIAATSLRPEIVAIYDDADRTIYLPEGWTGNTPAAQSIVIHELVHHLQNLAGVRYSCPEERERAAYEAQKRWLDMLGTSLEAEFGIDPFTLLVRTTCKY